MALSLSSSSSPDSELDPDVSSLVVLDKLGGLTIGTSLSSWAIVVCRSSTGGGGLPVFERRDRCDAALLEADDAEPESLSEPDDEPLLLLSLLESLSESVLTSWKKELYSIKTMH